MNASFNSSDVEAYEQEQPIPIVKEAYFAYQRKKKQAQMRRASTLNNQGKELSPLKASSFKGSMVTGSIISELSSEVDLVVRKEEQTAYNDPNK